MKAVNRNNSLEVKPGLWRELYTIFLFYIKIFLAAALLSSIFFFLYAGIKTGGIPLDIVAGVSALTGSFAAVIALHFAVIGIFRKRLLSKTEKLDFELRHLEKVIQQIHRMRDEKTKISLQAVEEFKLSSANWLIRFTSLGLILRVLVRRIFTDPLSLHVGEMLDKKEDEES